jgi:hypothetical protein
LINRSIKHKGDHNSLGGNKGNSENDNDYDNENLGEDKDEDGGLNHILK